MTFTGAEFLNISRIVKVQQEQDNSIKNQGFYIQEHTTLGVFSSEVHFSLTVGKKPLRSFEVCDVPSFT